jgi:DNA polymerase
MTRDNTNSVALALLQWHIAMGVDEVIAGSPRNWFVEDGAPPPLQTVLAGSRQVKLPETSSRQPPPPQASRPIQPRRLVPAQEAEMQARELARSAQSLAELQSLLSGFDGCPLKKTAVRLCFARGSDKARVVLIGEAPGRDEEQEGLPFVGRAGKLLDKMLAAISLKPDDVYITNLVYWRPPGNRTPTPQEVQACQPFLERQIELVQPEFLVFLGSAAAKQLTGVTEGIIRIRGRWLYYESAGRSLQALPTLHPAYLLRNPVAKRLAWRDLLMLKAALTGMNYAENR